MPRYENISKLLSENADAKSYFSSLPDFVKTEMLNSNAIFRNEDDLYYYAQGIIHDFI